MYSQYHFGLTATDFITHIRAILPSVALISLWNTFSVTTGKLVSIAFCEFKRKNYFLKNLVNDR